MQNSHVPKYALLNYSLDTKYCVTVLLVQQQKHWRDRRAEKTSSKIL